MTTGIQPRFHLYLELRGAGGAGLRVLSNASTDVRAAMMPDSAALYISLSDPPLHVPGGSTWGMPGNTWEGGRLRGKFLVELIPADSE